jgi:hypothetical protein
MSVSQLPKDVLRLILFSLEPLDMFCSVSGVSKLFWEISKDETYWEREYGKRCLGKLKETLDRVKLSKRDLFLFFILNNPLRILFKNKISSKISKECRRLVEYMINSLREGTNNKNARWIGPYTYRYNDVIYFIKKDHNDNLELVDNFWDDVPNVSVLKEFGFIQRENK